MKAFRELYDVQIRKEHIKVSFPDFEGIAKRISDLDIYFFINEYYKPHPLIVYNKKGNNIDLALKLDEPWYKSYIPEVIEVYWSYELDGVTEHYAMPYYDYLLRYLPMKSWPKLLDEDYFHSIIN